MKIMCSFFVFLSVLSCGQNKDIKILDRSEFSICYPSDLELVESKDEGVVFVLKTSYQDEEDVFIENINLTTQEVNDIKFNDFIIKTEREIKALTEEVVEKRIIKVNGENCLRIIFNLRQNNTDLTFIQHYFIKNKKAYVLTFSSESAVYDKYFKEMNSVLMSFKLK